MGLASREAVAVSDHPWSNAKSSSLLAAMGAAASTGTKATKEAEKIFTKIDKDKNGKLSITELTEAATKYGEDIKKAWTKDRIEATVKKYDRDGDGQLNKKEWASALAELSKEPAATKPKKAAAAAAAAPAAEAAVSEPHEKKRALNASKAALEAGQKQCKSVFTSADVDRDGELSFKEFAAFLRKLNEEYEFMAAEGPKMSEYLKFKYTEAGGELAKPKKPSDVDEDAKLLG